MNEIEMNKFTTVADCIQRVILVYNSVSKLIQSLSCCFVGSRAKMIFGKHSRLALAHGIAYRDKYLYKRSEFYPLLFS